MKCLLALTLPLLFSFSAKGKTVNAVMKFKSCSIRPVLSKYQFLTAMPLPEAYLNQQGQVVAPDDAKVIKTPVSQMVEITRHQPHALVRTHRLSVSYNAAKLPAKEVMTQTINGHKQTVTRRFGYGGETGACYVLDVKVQTAEGTFTAYDRNFCMENRQVLKQLGQLALPAQVWKRVDKFNASLEKFQNSNEAKLAMARVSKDGKPIYLPIEEIDPRIATELNLMCMENRGDKEANRIRKTRGKTPKASGQVK